MPTVQITPDNYSFTTSTSSLILPPPTTTTTTITTQENQNHDQHQKDHHPLNLLQRQPTLTNLSRWVSRRISRAKLSPTTMTQPTAAAAAPRRRRRKDRKKPAETTTCTQTTTTTITPTNNSPSVYTDSSSEEDSAYTWSSYTDLHQNHTDDSNEEEEEEEEQRLADSYAAFCRAFTAGQAERQYYYPATDPCAYSGERFYRGNAQCWGGLDQEGLKEEEVRARMGEEEEEARATSRLTRTRTPPPLTSSSSTTTTTTSEHAPRWTLPTSDPCDEEHEPVEFRPVGAYGYAPPSPPPLSPPPRIRTPAIYYVEAQRVEQARRGTGNLSPSDQTTAVATSRMAWPSWLGRIGCWRR